MSGEHRSRRAGRKYQLRYQTHRVSPRRCTQARFQRFSLKARGQSWREPGNLIEGSNTCGAENRHRCLPCSLVCVRIESWALILFYQSSHKSSPTLELIQIFQDTTSSVYPVDESLDKVTFAELVRSKVLHPRNFVPKALTKLSHETHVPLLLSRSCKHRSTTSYSSVPLRM